MSRLLFETCLLSGSTPSGSTVFIKLPCLIIDILLLIYGDHCLCLGGAVATFLLLAKTFSFSRNPAWRPHLSLPPTCRWLVHSHVATAKRMGSSSLLPEEQEKRQELGCKGSGAQSGRAWRPGGAETFVWKLGKL